MSDIKITFEEVCWVCDGTGTPTTDYPARVLPNGKCERCKGKGYIPTELGEELLEFLEHQKR